MSNFQTVGKRAEWQTIDQRELKASRARRTQRRGQAALTTGALAAGGAYAVGSNGNLGDYRRNQAVRQADGLGGDAKLLRHLRREGVPKSALLRAAGAAVQRRPLGAALVGGGALAALGGGGMLQGSVREGYHQGHINRRRKSNAQRVKKNETWGAGSAVGRRVPIEKKSKHQSDSNYGGVLARNTAGGAAVGAGLSYRAGRQASNEAVSDWAQEGKIAPHKVEEWKRGDEGRRWLKSERKQILRRARSTGLVLGAGTAALGARREQLRRQGRRRAEVTKAARVYDAEDRRQRRLGGATALTAAGGALLGAKGLRGAKVSTQLGRGGMSFKANEQGLNPAIKARALRLRERGVSLTDKDLAQLAGGTALVGAAGGLTRYGDSRRNRRWE